MFEDLTEAIETIERQYKIGIDYGSQKDMTAVCLLGEQAEVVIKALAEYMELAKAKAEGRLVELPVKVGDLTEKYRELTKPMGDEIETYTTGYRNGYKNGQAELLAYLLQIDTGTREAAEKALGVGE